MTLIAKNVSISTQYFLGAVLPAGNQIDLTNQYTSQEIKDSVELTALINSGDIIMNNGVEDLSIDEAIQAVQAVNSVNGKTNTVILDPDDLDDSTTTNKFYPDADAVKLASIEDNADVTNSINVDAAGAVMNSDTDVAAMSFVINDDSMVTATDQVIATAGSVKAYIDTEVANAVIDTPYQGGYNATTNTPDLVTPPAGLVKKGYSFDVTFGGTFYGEEVEIGDLIKARVDDPASLSDWVILQDNLTAAQIKTKYESNANTNAFTDAEQTKLAGIDPGATDDQTGTEIKALYEAEPNTNAFTDALKIVLDYISATAPADLDLMQSDIAANNAKVSNATHTGEITGSTVLELDYTAIANQLTAVALNIDHFADYFLMYDASDIGAGRLKRISAEELAKSTFLRSLWSFTISNEISSNGTIVPVVKVTEQIPAAFPSGTYLARVETDWAQTNNNEISIELEMDQGGGWTLQKGVLTFKSNSNTDWRTITKHFPIVHTNGQDTDLRLVFYATGGSGNAQVRYSSIEFWRVY